MAIGNDAIAGVLISEIDHSVLTSFRTSTEPYCSGTCYTVVQLQVAKLWGGDIA